MPQAFGPSKPGLKRVRGSITYQFGPALIKARRGDSTGFASIYDHFNRQVSALVHSQGCENPDNSVNSVFEKAFRSIDRFVGNEVNFASFLYQIVRFQSIDELRARVEKTTPVRSSSGDSTEDDPTQELMSTSLRIDNALGALTLEQREVVALRVFFGLTGPQTALALEKPLIDIRSLENRAEARLRILAEPRAT